MATLPLSVIELVSTKRTVPLNGSPSSIDYNDDQNEGLIDLTSVTSFLNGTLIPLLQVLPLLSQTAGLEGRAINTDSTDLTPLCFNAKTATPLTLAQSIKYVNSILSSQQGQIQDMTAKVASLASQLSSTNQNSVSLAMQNWQSALNNITAEITAMQTQLALIQAGGGSGGSGGTDQFQYVGSTPNTAINFTLGSRWKVTLDCATNLSFEGAAVGDQVTVIIVQDATGNWPVTWANNIPGPPSPGAAAGSSSVYEFTYDGTNYICQSAVVN